MQQPTPPSEEELAQLQKLSNEYKPDVEGPLVGPLRSSVAIAAEYAEADPVYVQKTAALPLKYSHYRTIKGDGNCGWRAIAFGYFETLLRTQDPGRILMEAERIRGLNDLLKRAGHEEDLFTDFVDETLDTLRIISENVETGKGEALLLERFNDFTVSASIIAHFRLLTSAWMQKLPAPYVPFILDTHETIESYCATQIDPIMVEIEHVGMKALIDVMINPAGLAVEVLYLDRSEGAEVNSHYFEPLDDNGGPLFLGCPTMRLLYRPGHYDILYRPEETPQVLEVALVSNLSSSAVFNTTSAAPGRPLPDYMWSILGVPPHPLPFDQGSEGPISPQPSEASEPDFAASQACSPSLQPGSPLTLMEVASQARSPSLQPGSPLTLMEVASQARSPSLLPGSPLAFMENSPRQPSIPYHYPDHSYHTTKERFSPDQWSPESGSARSTKREETSYYPE